MRSRSARRSRSPPGPTTAVPKRATTCASPGKPGATTARAASSASITGTPNSRKRWATVLLPLAMPPVNPIDKRGRMASSWLEARELQVEAHQRAPVEHCEPACRGEVGPEGHRSAAVSSAKQDHRDAHDRTGGRRQQDHERQQLPAEPGAECRVQLEIAVAHALLAGREAKRVE